MDETYLLLTGMKVVNDIGTFYFSEPGNWIADSGRPIYSKLYRTDGPSVEYANGTKFWYLNGEIHRTDGPAIEHSDGSVNWCMFGKLHREDGPAKQFADGSAEWWEHGTRIG